ncbi:MAG TPA: DUF3303 family protein [Nonomuraea sp.]|nr:DUF3303 family protein [Nonomuraea sp.]
MLFMVIERFCDNDMVPIYRKVRDGGRLMPEGLTYPVVTSEDTRDVVEPYLDPP